MTTSTRISMGVHRFQIMLIAILALGGCASIAQRASVERRPLTFVGQVSFGSPQVRASRVVVPLTFTGGEWGEHSAIAAYRVESRVSGRTIEMTVLTSLVGDEPAPQELRLGSVAAGQYAVVYRDPDGTKHSLGQIEIPSTR